MELQWECYRCSHIFEGENPPEECPNCHYSLAFWLEHVEARPATVKEFFRGGLLKLESDRTVLDAARVMRENDASSVIVTVDGEPKGIVTETDILFKVAAEDLPPSRTTLKQTMTPGFYSIESSAALTEAIMMMAKHHTRRLVVTENGKPVGMISQRSIIGGSFRALTKETDRPEKFD